MSQVAVVGAGYVGLTTGACLARMGHNVVCGDVVPAKVALLSRGQIPIVEAGLDDLVCEGLDAGRLSFVVGARTAVEGAEFVFLCVPTPQDEDGSAGQDRVDAGHSRAQQVRCQYADDDAAHQQQDVAITDPA